jgi:CRP/FNR family transcriptional regulator
MHASALRAVPAYRGPSPKRTRPVLREVSNAEASCVECGIAGLCMPSPVSAPDAKHLFDELVSTRIRLRKGDVLFRAGDRFTALFAVRVGSCKTVSMTDDGTEQVSGHYLPGEIMGVEGIGADVHTCQSVALEDSEVCVLPFDRIGELSREVGALQHHLHRIMSREIVREHGVMLLLGTMRAEERVAAIPEDAFQSLLEAVKPQPKESPWRDIEWVTNITEARRRAVAEGKPLVIFTAADGSPLGRT